MISSLRFEAKYLLDYSSYYRVRSSLMPFCGLDEFSRSSPRGRYLVRSLYYDTADYKTYVEKVTGVSDRNKLRIRTYFPIREETAFLNVEQKRRYGKLIAKYTSRISIDQYDRFVRTGSWGDTEDALLQDFERIVRTQHLKPVTVVNYMREAYVARDRSGVRFSFDHDVRYARSSDLFFEEWRYKRDLGRNIVFEIKCSRDDIGWISDLVRRHDLKAVPNSKYVNAIDHTRQAIRY